MTTRRICALAVLLVAASVAAWGTITITPASLPGGALGTANYSQQLTPSPSSPAPVWSISAGALPGGLTLNSSTGLISGTLTPAGTFSFTVAATTAMDSGSQNYTINVISITTTSPLPGGTVGQNYSQQLVSNPVGTTWAVVTGTLPPGLSLNGATGVISGQLLQVAQTTVFNFTVSASIGSDTATKALSITVSPGPLTLTIPNNLLAQVNVAFSTQLTGTGGVPPYTFVLASGTQNGLSLTSSTGVLSGTPTVAGATNLVITLKDSLGNQTGGTVVINVIGIAPTLPNGAIGVPYSQTLSAPGGFLPLTWTLVSGSLPPGLTMSASGMVTGTPTANGSYPFVVSVTDAKQNSTSGTVTIVIGSSFSITTTSLPNGTTGQSYSQTLTSTGGTGTVTWSATGVPTGLTLNATTGVLAGTPTAAGTFTISVTATDSATPTPNTATASLSLTVVAPPFNITTSSLAPATTGASYSQTIVSTGGTGPFSWSVSGQPTGLTLDSTCTSASCTFSGTPTVAGTFTVNFTVRDSTGAVATASLSLVVSAPALTITDVLPGCFIATAGRPFPDSEIKPANPPAGCPTSYQYTVTGATGSVTWTATGLPTGLTLSGTGVLSGRPTTAGTTSFTVIATDSTQQKGVLSTSITVVALGKPSSSDIILGGNSGGPVTANTQPAMVVSIGGTFPFAISGVVTMTYASSVGGDDQLVRFGNGTRRTTFNIPANTSRTPVNDGNVVLTGTVSGTITLSATFTDNFGNDMTPTPQRSVTYTVTAGVPVITRVVIRNASTSGMTLDVTGFSTPRNMSNAVFHFTPTSTTNLGGGVGTVVDVTVQLGTAFTTWYNSTASNAFGSLFTVSIPFTFGSTGAISAAPVASVTVNMTNSLGASTTSTPVSP